MKWIFTEGAAVSEITSRAVDAADDSEDTNIVVDLAESRKLIHSQDLKSSYS